MTHVDPQRSMYHLRHVEFERLGLRSTEREPLHVYCKICQIEIDPLRQTRESDFWWRCPRGCNAARVH